MSPSSLLALSLLLQAPAGGFSPEKHPVSPDGTRATCDIPPSQHIRNTGGRDGAGLCVFTSMELAADWQQLPELAGFQRWMTKRPGGGYPEKVDAMLKAYCQEKGVPVPPYVQHTDGDEAVLDAAIAAGLMPCITYGGRDDFYRGGIYHMVDLAHLDAERAAIIDNNRPGVWVWMTRAELLTRWRSMQGGWAFVWLASPPPPYDGPPRAAFEAPANFGVDPQKVHDPMDPKGEEKNNYGIVVAKLRAAPKWSLTGAEVGRDAALDAIRAIGDRANVAAVGDDAVHKTLREAVAGLTPDQRKRLHVQCYGPSEWETGQFGLDAGLTVRSVAVARVGKGLARLDAYNATSPTAVRAAILAALSPPAPLPQPGPGPDPAPAPPPPVDPPARGGWWSWPAFALGVGGGVALVVLLHYLLPRKESVGLVLALALAGGAQAGPVPCDAQAGGGKPAMRPTPYAEVRARVERGEPIVMLVKPAPSVTFPVRLGWTTLRCDDAPVPPGRYDCWLRDGPEPYHSEPVMEFVPPPAPQPTTAEGWYWHLLRPGSS